MVPSERKNQRLGPLVRGGKDLFIVYSSEFEPSECINGKKVNLCDMNSFKNAYTIIFNNDITEKENPNPSFSMIKVQTTFCYLV